MKREIAESLPMIELAELYVEHSTDLDEDVEPLYIAENWDRSDLLNELDYLGIFYEDDVEDLFQLYHDNPKILSMEMLDLLNKYEDECDDQLTYEQCKTLLEESEKLGYTFDYGLDVVPFNLRKIY
jgi:hypothetical protein